MKIRFILAIFINLFLLSACGFESSSQSNSDLLNKEETNERDISKSEKTTEKFSESVGEKVSEVPQNLLSGFRKSGISEKIKVTEGVQPIGYPPLTSREQNEKNDELQDAVKNSSVPVVRHLLSTGADPKIAWAAFERTGDSVERLKILALLMLYGGHPPSQMNLTEKFRLLVSGIISPEDVLEFNLKVDLMTFSKNGKTILERSNLYGLYYHLSNQFKAFNAIESLVHAFKQDKLELVAKYFEIYFNKKFDRPDNLLRNIVESSPESELRTELEKNGGADNVWLENDESQNPIVRTPLMAAVTKRSLRKSALLIKYGAQRDFELFSRSALERERMSTNPFIEALLLGLISPDEVLNIGDPEIEKQVFLRQKNKETIPKVALTVGEALRAYDQYLKDEIAEAAREIPINRERINRTLTLGAELTYTILFEAVRSSNIEVIRLCLKSKLDPFKVFHGMSAIDAAPEDKKEEIIEEFKKFKP